MSYYSNVAVAFKSEDWHKLIVPELNKLQGEEAVLYSQGESYYDKDTDSIIVRWNSVNHWQHTNLARILKRFARKVPSDYCEVGGDFVTNKLPDKQGLGIIERYNPYFRFPNEVGVYALDKRAIMCDEAVELF